MGRLGRMLMRGAAGSGSATDLYWSYVSFLLGTTAINTAQNNTFLDSSTNNLTVTRVGNATQGSNNPYETLWSVYLDGSGDYLTAPTNAVYDVSGGDYTIEAWINFSALPAANNSGNRVAGVGIYSSGFGGGWEIGLDLTQNIVSINQPGSSSFTSANYTFAIGQWYHVAVCRASGTNRIFVNGTSLTLAANTFPNNATGSAQLRIGAGLFSGGYEHYFPGYISNFRLVKGTGLYSSDFTPSTTPLTAVSGTSILTAQSNRFKDNSTNNATISPAGDARVTAFSPFGLARSGSSAYSGTNYGGSLYLDALGTTSTIPNVYTATSTALDLQSGGTIECWFYLTGRPLKTAPPLDTVNTIWACYGTSLGGITKYFALGVTDTGYLYISVDQGAGYTDNISTTYIQLNTWYHVAWVRSGGANKFYLNGVDVTSTFSNPNLSNFPSPATSNQLWVGVVPYLFGSYTYLGPFKGYISDVRVVKGTAVYTTGFTPPTAPLTAISNTSVLLSFTNGGIFDASMNNDMETVGDAQVSTSIKKYGSSSIALDGTGDWLYAPGSPAFHFGSGNFTIEGWFYFTNATANALQGIFTNYTTWNASGQGTIFWGKHINNSGYMTAWFSNYSSGGALLAESSYPPSNTWVHYALVRNGNTFTMYRDGTATATATWSGSATTISPPTIFIGTAGDATQYAFPGYIDDFRITRGIARYTSDFTPPSQALPTR